MKKLTDLPDTVIETLAKIEANIDAWQRDDPVRFTYRCRSCGDTGYVLGDASYVNSLTCNATGSYQRDDTPYSRAFLESWIP